MSTVVMSSWHLAMYNWYLLLISGWLVAAVGESNDWQPGNLVFLVKIMGILLLLSTASTLDISLRPVHLIVLQRLLIIVLNLDGQLVEMGELLLLLIIIIFGAHIVLHDVGHSVCTGLSHCLADAWYNIVLIWDRLAIYLGACECLIPALVRSIKQRKLDPRRGQDHAFIGLWLILISVSAGSLHVHGEGRSLQVALDATFTTIKLAPGSVAPGHHYGNSTITLCWTLHLGQICSRCRVCIFLVNVIRFIVFKLTVLDNFLNIRHFLP